MNDSNDKDYMEKYKKYKKKYLNTKNSLLIFDFDRTLSKTSLGPYTDPLNYQLCELFLDQDFINNLKDFKDKNNNNIAILSFGYRNVIDLFLDKYDLKELFDTVLTPSAFYLYEGYDYSKKFDGKNKMISVLNDIYKANRIMLVDDNIININHALNAGFSAVLSDDTGLSLKQKNEILQFVNI